MRALVFVGLLVACTEHGKGGGGPPDGPIISDDDLAFPRCVDGVACKAGETCQIEGHAACNNPPASGGCDCVDGSFVCFTSCPTGCPENDIPQSGDSCPGVENGATCQYEDPPFSSTRTTCQCNAGTFTCTTL